MKDDFEPERYDEQYFKNLLENIEEHPQWEYSNQNNHPRDQRIDTAAYFDATKEVFIDNKSTDGTLHLMMPHRHEPVAAATGTLDQPLDGTQKEDPYKNSFGEKILKAYESTVEGHSAEYLKTEPDTISIASITIPLEYNEDTLQETLEIADQVSRDIQDLNDDVESVLENQI